MSRISRLVVVLGLWASNAAHAESEEASTSAPTRDSPGPLVHSGRLRPDASAHPLRACSFRHTVCVHAPRSTSYDAILGALEAAERAWETATGALDLPSPDPDPVTGAYDIYLVERPEIVAETAIGERDVRGRLDRASAFTTIDRRLTGCARDRAVSRELFRAILFRVSPAMDEGSALAQTTALAELVAGCAPIDTTLFQAHPERAIADIWTEAPREVGARFGEGAALVYDWLDTSFGARPGAIVGALWALSPTMTETGARRWSNEPDTFDVLRMSFRNALSTGSTVEDLFREIGVARALAGAPVKLDWSIDWPDKPRRFAFTSGVAPTGSSYVGIRRAGAPNGSRLRIEVEWEQHAKMRWSVVKLDPGGREIGHISVPTTERSTQAQMTVVDLDVAASLLLVGTNVGDPLYPFDPDDEVWEPHGWILTVASE